MFHHWPLLSVVLAVAGVMAAALTLLGLARMAWRFLRDEDMEAGGSWGKQMSARGDRSNDTRRR